MRFTKMIVGAGVVALSAAGLMATQALAQEEPNYTVPHSSDANQAWFWEEHFNVDGVEGVTREKNPEGDISDPYVVGEAPEGRDWHALILKAGAGDDANEVYVNPVAGKAYTYTDKDISHVILCSAPESEPTPTPTPEPTPTPTPSPEPTPTPTPTPTPGEPTPTPEKPEKPTPEKPGKPGKPGQPGKPGTMPKTGN